MSLSICHCWLLLSLHHFFFGGGGGGGGRGVWLVGRLVGWLVVLTYFTMVRESVGLSF